MAKSLQLPFLYQGQEIVNLSKYLVSDIRLSILLSKRLLLHKQIYRVRFIANSSSGTITELSKLLTSCLTTSKIMLLNILKTSMKGRVKIFLGQSKIHLRYYKLKSRGFRASSRSYI